MSPKRLLITAALAAVAASATAAPASATSVDPPRAGSVVGAAGDPASQWPVAGASVQAALQIAGRTWGVPVCPQGGGFSVAWSAQPDHINAMATWTGDRDRPLGMIGCSVTLNPQVGWDWPKLCTVVVHEVGHLSGMRHVEDEEDVMSATYHRPMAACLVPDPQVKAAPVARAKLRRAATRAAKAAKTRSAPRTKRTTRA